MFQALLKKTSELSIQALTLSLYLFKSRGEKSTER